MKFVSLISRGPGQEGAAFRQWFVREHAPAMLKQIPRLNHFIVNVNDVSPDFGDAQPLRTAPVPYDVVTEMWLEPASSGEGAAELYQTAVALAVEQSLRSRSATCHSYLVADVVEKDAQKFAPGGARPRRQPGFRDHLGRRQDRRAGAQWMAQSWAAGVPDSYRDDSLRPQRDRAGGHTRGARLQRGRDALLSHRAGPRAAAVRFAAKRRGNRKRRRRLREPGEDRHVLHRAIRYEVSDWASRARRLKWTADCARAPAPAAPISAGFQV